MVNLICEKLSAESAKRGSRVSPVCHLSDTAAQQVNEKTARQRAGGGEPDETGKRRKAQALSIQALDPALSYRVNGEPHPDV